MYVPDANTVATMAWANRMADRYGDRVYDREIGEVLDWGQALCREQYGPDWGQDPPERPTAADVDRALRWERGEWPGWALPVRMKAPTAGTVEAR